MHAWSAGAGVWAERAVHVALSQLPPALPHYYYDSIWRDTKWIPGNGVDGDDMVM